MRRLLAEIACNVRGFLAVDRMHVPEEWPNTRVQATLEAHGRLRQYAREREERTVVYASNAASEGYRRRWRDRTRVVFDADFVHEGRGR